VRPRKLKLEDQPRDADDGRHDPHRFVVLELGSTDLGRGKILDRRTSVRANRFGWDLPFKRSGARGEDEPLSFVDTMEGIRRTPNAPHFVPLDHRPRQQPRCASWPQGVADGITGRRSARARLRRRAGLLPEQADPARQITPWLGAGAARSTSTISRGENGAPGITASADPVRPAGQTRQ